MDERSQQILNAILAKSVGELTETDKAFLRARQSYLGRRERQRYEEVLNAKPQPVEPKVEETPAPLTHPADQTVADTQTDTGVSDTEGPELVV